MPQFLDQLWILGTLQALPLVYSSRQKLVSASTDELEVATGTESHSPTFSDRRRAKTK